jgi:phosphatidate cytidylyltransferase
MFEGLRAVPELYVLFGGLIALLAVSSTIAAVLSRRARARGGSAGIANLVARINAWWVMVAVLAAAFLFGTTFTLCMFALMSYFALREFITLTPTRPSDRLPLAVAFFLILPGQYVLIGISGYGAFVLMPVYAFLLLPAIAAMAGDVTDFLSRTAKLQWGLMTIVYALSHAPALLLLPIDGYENRNALLLFYLLFVVQISDVLQYVFGKLLGKTKIAPVVSPSKTVGGFVGGGLAATAVGASLWWITPFTPLMSAAMSAAIVLMGFYGGLALSAVKRSLGAKDWGVMIEGHGGMLDRLDSLCFAAPVFYHLTRYFYG